MYLLEGGNVLLLFSSLVLCFSYLVNLPPQLVPFSNVTCAQIITCHTGLKELSRLCVWKICVSSRAIVAELLKRFGCSRVPWSQCIINGG